MEPDPYFVGKSEKASGRAEGGGQKRKSPELTGAEKDFKEWATGEIKKRKTLGPFRDRTGRRTSQRSWAPMGGGHPLKGGNPPGDPDDESIDAPDEHVPFGALERDSEQLARAVGDDRRFTPQNRPTMASALLVGDSTQAGTSMRRGNPTLHPLVSRLLDQIPSCCRGNGHGHCGEVNTISNHLWMVDRSGRWTERKARSYFEHGGAATAAHRRTDYGIELTNPCRSCVYLTQVLCIATVNDTTPNLHQLVEYIVSGVRRRYLHCGRTAAISNYLWEYEKRHGAVDDIDQVRSYLQGMRREELANRIDHDLVPTCPCCRAVIQELLRTRPGG